MSKAEEILKKHFGTENYTETLKAFPMDIKAALAAMEEYASKPLPGEDWRQSVEDFWNLCGFDHIADNRYWHQWIGLIEEIIREQLQAAQPPDTETTPSLNKDNCEVKHSIRKGLRR